MSENADLSGEKADFTDKVSENADLSGGMAGFPDV